MAAHHDEVPIADLRDATWFAASMNRDVLADNVVFTQDDAALHRWIKAKVLRFSTDDGRAPDDRVWPDGDVPNNLAVRLQSTSGSDFGRAVK
jgi:hypothetical protein